MQLRVREKFRELQAIDEKQQRQCSDGSQQQQPQVPWYVINAAQSIEDVQKEINTIVNRTIQEVQSTNKPLGLLWKQEQVLDSDSTDRQQEVSPKSTMENVQDE